MNKHMLGALALVTLLAGCPPEEEPTPTAPADRVSAILDLQGDATAGETVYADNCASCHGADGTGQGEFPGIVGEVGEGNESEVLAVVLNGQGNMPAFDSLSDQELADLLAFLATL